MPSGQLGITVRVCVLTPLPLTLTLIESVARQLAVAIENARLHAEERSQRHLAETLREVAGVLSTDDINHMLQQMLTLLRRVLRNAGFAASAFGGVHPRKDPDEALLAGCEGYVLLRIRRGERVRRRKPADAVVR